MWRGMSAKKSSTLGYERRANPMLRFPSFDAFKADVLSAFPVRPKSFSHIIQTNLTGAATLDACPMDKNLTPRQFEEMIADGATIIDARDSAAFGGFHIPGSINIGFEKQLAVRLDKGDVRIIDVRTPAEWNEGHIEQAEHYPLTDILNDQFPEAEKDEELVLQCGSGYRSNSAASILRQAGYAFVKSLAGGVFAWSNAGFPLISS
jgi:rhodanese-related sulfurtransferase